MNSTLRFYKCEEIFGELPLWKSVPETERKDIFSDVVHNLAKKEKEQAKVIKRLLKINWLVNFQLMNIAILNMFLYLTGNDVA